MPFQLMRRMRALAGVLALVCTAVSLSSAQRYSFREYTQGLGNLNITSLMRDRTGYLWVGTQNGLYRYDGGGFQSFGPAQGLPERMVQNLFLGVDGTLWVASTTGIYFEGPDGRFTEIAPPAPMKDFLQDLGTEFAANGPDELVTITRQGAFRFQRAQDGGWTAAALALQGGALGGLIYTPDGALWYGCDGDLCRLANGKTERMRAALGLPEEKWVSMLVTQDGHLWVRGKSHVGDIDLAARKFTLHDLPGLNSPEAYPALAQDAEGRVLTAKNSSLALWENGKWRLVTDRNGLAAYEIQTVYVDPEGSAWLGQVGHGLKRWVGQDRWEGYTKADGLSDDLVWRSMRDRAGRLWVGTETGLDWIPPGSETPRVWKQNGIQTARAGALAESADGAIWMGSAAGSLLRIDGASLTGRQWKLPEVYDIAIDPRGRLWVATFGGLYTMSTDGPLKTPELVTDPVFGNAHQRFNDLCLDARGNVWVAADQGLFVLDEPGWHHIDLGASGAAPDTIALAKDGSVWAGGPSQQLMRLTIRHYRVVDAKRIAKPPLMSEQVVSLMVDDRGWLWVGEDAGLTVFDGAVWHSYTQNDGLLWNDTDSFALDEDKDGSIWVGTSGGLSHLLTPKDTGMSSPPMPPALSQVTYGNTVLRDGASVPWGSTSLEISMALLSFKGTESAGIRYRLVGEQSSEWEESREMHAHFHDLPPGKYRFDVAQIDQAGHPVSPVGSFSLEITPRWWQRSSLRAALMMLGVLLLIALWRHRIGVLLKQKKSLEEAVRARTGDLEKEKLELVRTKEQMRHFAEHDDLTGLWNHRIIVDRLRIEVDRSRREGTPMSIILADLDFFKRINDTFGHPAGDMVLREASVTFQRMVRTYDWVGRYGGEEFLLILPGSSLAQATQRAEELRIALQTTRVREGEALIPLTASFGVASGYVSSQEDLIREADEALYRAKNNGRNCVVAVEVDKRRPKIVQRVS
ncbi:MAG TPA: diguanylate cyclase [Terracidiphilus sp.]|nr:diguanylate cyclase [Terracidiphilus sp.]